MPGARIHDHALGADAAHVLEDSGREFQTCGHKRIWQGLRLKVQRVRDGKVLRTGVGALSEVVKSNAGRCREGAECRLYFFVFPLEQRRNIAWR